MKSVKKKKILMTMISEILHTDQQSLEVVLLHEANL